MKNMWENSNNNNKTAQFDTRSDTMLLDQLVTKHVAHKVALMWLSDDNYQIYFSHLPFAFGT